MNQRQLAPGDAACALQLLEAALYHPNALRAQQAAEQLAAATLGRSGFELLGRAATDSDPDVRRRCVKVLGRLPEAAPAIPLITRALDDPVWTVREAAALALVHFVQADCEPAAMHDLLIDRALHDKSPFVRDAALQSLTQLEGRADAAVDALRQGLADRRPPVRCRAVAALTCFATRADVFLPELLQALDDPHHRVRRAAVVALPRLGQNATAAIPHLVRRCCEGEPNIRRAARQSLAKVLESAPEDLQRDLAPLADGSLGVEETLQGLLAARSPASAAANALLQICRRRINWWQRLPGQSAAAEGDLTDPWMAASTVADAAVGSAADSAQREAARQRELAWLLGQLLEIRLRPPDQATEPLRA